MLNTLQQPSEAETMEGDFVPRVIAWELTRRCPSACKHCRAAAADIPYEHELTAKQCRQVIENIAGFARPLMILTGGEPLLREDIYQIVQDCRQAGLRTALATCGPLLNDPSVLALKDAGLDRISLSLDGADAATHDEFRRVPGSFDAVIQAAQSARRHQLPFQINTTVTQHNHGELARIMALAQQLGAAAFNPFLLVPVGRGAELAEFQLSAAQYEMTLDWLAERSREAGIQIRVTCAPHFQRILRQTAETEPYRHPLPTHNNSAKAYRDLSGGCLGGKSFAFISHTGRVQLCGFLEHPAGELQHNHFDFHAVWQDSELFHQVRDVDGYHGKCGRCEYRGVCGGCRARAFAATGDILGPEPWCVYQPPKTE
jgi:AdoMet-dependent heme synthase